jgi:hypothetical protein
MRIETLAQAREYTQGSKTFQYLVEKRTIVISLVAASEKERAQTQRKLGVVRQKRAIYSRRVTNCVIS